MNRLPALRVDHPGVHAACCGANTWTAAQGSLTVFINGKSAHRMGDQTRHCGGAGRLIEGSPNVMVGESSNAGTGQVASSRVSITPVTGSSAAPTGALAAISVAAPAAASAPDVAAPPPPAPGGEVPAIAPDDPPTWLEIELIGEDGNGVVGERYVVVPPSGGPVTGFLDEDGRAILDGLTPGTCQVSFPDLDSDAWQPTTP